jgi:hypothetical protein
MNPRSRFVLCALGSVLATAFVACFADRPLLIAVDADGGAPVSGSAGAGAAGTAAPGSGSAGAVTPGSGSAGGTGTAGAGQAGTGGGCDIRPILTAVNHNCTLAGACHDAMGSAAGLDLTSTGLEARLLGGTPRASFGVNNALQSMCAGQGRTYLVPGSRPATGLFLDKIGTANPPCGLHMPSIGNRLNAAELDCVQRWADKVTATVRPVGCDITPIINSPLHTCTLAGACHDAQGSAAGLNLVSPGWERRLVGGMPQSGSSPIGIQSLCAGQGRSYLVPGSQPATGLFLDKLTQSPPPCGAHMPDLGSPLTPAELACVQSWASALTAP